MNMKEVVYSIICMGLFFLITVPISAALSDDCKSCHFNSSYMNNIGAPDKFINGTLYTNNSHVIIDCSSCHQYDHQANLTYNGNYVKTVDPLDPVDDTYNRDNFTLCFRCHDEAELLSIPIIDPFINLLTVELGITLFNQPFGTNFAGQSWWKNDASNLHYFHVVELRAMGGVPSRSAVCSNCHDPHGTNGPALVQDSIDLQYFDANGQPIINHSLKNLSTGARVSGFSGDLEYCQPCHTSDNSYDRSYKPVEIVITHQSQLPNGVNLNPTCADYACHVHDNDLRVQHVYLKNLTCETCHLSNRTDVQIAINYKKTACGLCHDHDIEYVPRHGACDVCHNF